MEFKAFLIKYAEIGVKGKNRFRFEDALIQQMRYALQPVGEFSIRKESGRIFVDALEEYDYDEAVEALSRVFGIAGICPIVVEENKDFDHIAAVVCDYVGERYEDRTFSFKVNVRRADKKYPIKSMDVAALLPLCHTQTDRSVPVSGRNHQTVYYIGASRTKFPSKYHRSLCSK